MSETRFSLEKELRTALHAAADAARRIHEVRRRGFQVETKADNSPVTAADRTADETIRAAIARGFPDDAILTEESGRSGGSGRRRWIVDPIDGTRAFTRGLPFWSILIGLEIDGEPELGVASFPDLGVTYHAVSGSGAWQGNRRIEVSPIPIWERAVIMTGEIEAIENATKQSIRELLGGCWSFRCYGDAIGACLVAEGRADLWIEAGVQRWDLVAVAPILREAGAQLTSLDGSNSLDSGNVVAANLSLHALAMDRLNARR